jgi:hypothetical protein
MPIPRFILALPFAGVWLLACQAEDKEGTSLGSQGSMSQGSMSQPLTGGMTEASETGAPTTTAAATSGDTSTSDDGTTTSPPDPSTTSGNPNTTASPDPVGNCCTPHPEPGCSNSDIKACVCGFDLNCCSPNGGGWDEVCVIEVESSKCAVCP